MKTKIINACTDLGVSKDGASLGPKELTKNLKDIDIINIEALKIKKSHDKNDLRKNEKYINEFNERLYKEIVNTKDFVITIGGDHSLAIGSGLASIKKHDDLGIVWIDAHPDYNTFETTITGNIHGLPLATLDGINGTDISYFHDGNYYNPKETVIVGARAIDPLEGELVKKNNVNIFYSKDINKDNISSIMEESFKLASSNGNKKIHVSFDIDVMDPEFAPGVSVPEVNGLTFEIVDNIFDFIYNNLDKIASFDIVEYNPLYDKNNITLNYVFNKLEKLINSIID